MLEQLNFVGEWLKMLLIEELERQGHVASRKLLESVEVVADEIQDGFELKGSFLYYGRFVDTGRKAGVKKVPISALIEWIRVKKISLRGNSEKQVAFAIQTAIFQKGIPTDGDEKKKRWMSATLEVNEAELLMRIREVAGYYTEQLFDNMIEETQKLFKESIAA